MKKLIFVYLFSLSTWLSAQAPLAKGFDSIDRKKAEASVRFLSSDALCGRQAGRSGSILAAEYIKSKLIEIGVEPLVDSYNQPFEAYARERQKKTRFQVNPDSVSTYKQEKAYRKLNLNNVIGCIRGERTDEVVIVGAHFDHLGMDDSLAGDKIYNGADDNASGVSAVLQIAHAFAMSGQKPLRTIIFAFWDGEEIGLLGSHYFVQNYSQLENIKGYLNFDMIGRNTDESKPNHVVYFYTQSTPSFGKWLEEDIKKYNLKIEPQYKPSDNTLGGSDNASFGKQNIPIAWYHTDGHADYHQPSDEASKLNWNKLVEITKASYLTMWRMANQEVF